MASYVGWVDRDDGRGTLDLVHGAVATVVLCTWDSLHMNVPADNDSYMTIFLRQLRWMAYGMICPEWSAILALRERYESRWSHRETWKLIEAKVS